MDLQRPYDLITGKLKVCFFQTHVQFLHGTDGTVDDDECPQWVQYSNIFQTYTRGDDRSQTYHHSATRFSYHNRQTLWGIACSLKKMLGSGTT